MMVPFPKLYTSWLFRGISLLNHFIMFDIRSSKWYMDSYTFRTLSGRHFFGRIETNKTRVYPKVFLSCTQQLKDQPMTLFTQRTR